MSQSPDIEICSHPMKKNHHCCPVVVVMGHVGVLWAVNHMKANGVKPIEKSHQRLNLLKLRNHLNQNHLTSERKAKPEPKKKNLKKEKIEN